MKTGRIKPGQSPQPTDARKGTVGRPRGTDVRPRGALVSDYFSAAEGLLKESTAEKDGKEEEVKDGGDTEEMERRMLPEATVSR